MAPAQSASPGSSDPSSGARFAFDARRWTRYEVITAGLSLALLAFLTRPWFEVRFFNCPASRNRCQSFVIGSVAGTDRHGYLWITVLPLLVIVTLLVLRAGFGKVSALTWPDDRHLLAGAACANLVIVLVAFLTKSAIVSAGEQPHPPSPYAGLSITWESAAYVALVLCVAAAVAAVLNLPTVRRAAATSAKHSLRRVASRASFLVARTPATR
jgi:hypothetical protein